MGGAGTEVTERKPKGVKELLGKYGVAKLSAVKLEDYSVLLVEALMGRHALLSASSFQEVDELYAVREAGGAVPF